MDWSYWPQWLAIFILAFPVVAWPVSRAAGIGRKREMLDWLGEYLGVVTGKSAFAAILYFGGFWA